MALSAALPGAQALPPVAVESYPPAARDPLTKALTEARDHPDDPARVGALAMLLQAWEEWASAAAVYTRARTLERRFDWYYLGGVAETHQAHYADAAILLAQAVQLEPSSVPARLNLADALFESGALDESERLYAVLAEEPAAEAHARYGLGRVRAGHGQFQAAVTEFDAAVRLYPEFGAAWYARGLALRNLNRLDDARESLARGQTYGARWPAVEDPLLAHVRALRGDGGAHMMRGLALERQGDVAGATAEDEAAVEVNPELAQAHINLIALYGRQQEWSKAEAHYDAAVKLGSGLADANYNYGVLQVAQGKMDAGRASLPPRARREPAARGRLEQPGPDRGSRRTSGRGGGLLPSRRGTRSGRRHRALQPGARAHRGTPVRGRDRAVRRARRRRQPGAPAVHVRSGHGSRAGGRRRGRTALGDRRA